MKKTAKTKKTDDKKVKDRIESLLKKVRPYIEMHGGTVHMVSFENGIVSLDIGGACAHCGMANMTYNNLVAGLLKDEIPEVKDILLIKNS